MDSIRFCCWPTGLALQWILGHEVHVQDLRQAGLYLGAEWREDRAGTWTRVPAKAAKDSLKQPMAALCPWMKWQICR